MAKATMRDLWDRFRIRFLLPFFLGHLVLLWLLEQQFCFCFCFSDREEDDDADDDDAGIR
jgi:hypothetical protein